MGESRAWGIIVGRGALGLAANNCLKNPNGSQTFCERTTTGPALGSGRIAGGAGLKEGAVGFGFGGTALGVGAVFGAVANKRPSVSVSDGAGLVEITWGGGVATGTV